jgi:hypothetical protein
MHPAKACLAITNDRQHGPHVVRFVAALVARHLVPQAGRPPPRSENEPEFQLNRSVDDQIRLSTQCCKLVHEGATGPKIPSRSAGLIGAASI